ncbi:putative 5-formyltetrahydrofolate cyclo-ligase [Pseudoruegeria aquimaris]|uniref:5-formyltetrahydrofolate cyclo-ligase n=1 Tax=Pseudoruegeria aquimaris TaxID=393663 RepID=A0A1Y5TNS4_9RHOB|nr:5-formyltetrahydrofolate cyclo-ligase [Pseudoruegeria aquimaris]SLN68307.1 putative 5-formyltetrahydrofolate cyclo-ligase [Pseudoruegeria aquimaris]
MTPEALAEAKAAARKAAFARRKAAHAAGRDAAAQAHLAEALAPHAGQPLAGYMPIRTEVSPLPVMAAHAARAAVGVPVILGEGRPLVFRQWAPGCAMEEGAFGALIPADGAEITPRILIVPLVAFDARGGRLGYGGGFYDRTLEGLRARGPVLAFGFAYAAQQADDLPLEPTDQPLDAIITDAGILRF